MSMLKMTIASSLLSLTMAGCVAERAIIAGAIDTVGVGIATNAAEQGATLTVGFKGAKFAVVPVENTDGEILDLAMGPESSKSFSVATGLVVNANAGVGSAGLGARVDQFLAVGPAAELLSIKPPLPKQN